MTHWANSGRAGGGVGWLINFGSKFSFFQLYMLNFFMSFIDAAKIRYFSSLSHSNSEKERIKEMELWKYWF